MSSIVILAMHGAPPNDFPAREMAEFFALHGRLEHAAGPEREPLERRHEELHARMRAWPRTPQNDRFWAASFEMADQLSRATGQEVLVGFNEFCAPTLEEALDQAVARDADKVVVLTPMMTRGGQHAEVDIPAAIQLAQERHPETLFEYAWPFPMDEIAGFLASQIASFL